MRCQYESRVCRIQISLQGLEARNHPESLVGSASVAQADQ